MSSPEPLPSPAERRRRWFQYRLRTLVVFVLMCAIPGSWFAVRMQQAKKQREAVEAIERLLGSVWYDYQDRDGELPGPTWLRDLLGDDFFARVVGVNLGSAQVTDTDLKHIITLSQLRRLDLGSKPITDAGLEHLRGLSQLRVLILTGTRITDAGLKYLTKLAQLQEICVHSTQLTDQTINQLQRALPNCKIQR